MKLIITLAIRLPTAPGEPGAYAAVCRYRAGPDQPSGLFTLVEGASYGTSSGTLLQQMASLLKREIIDPAPEEDTITLRTQSHQAAITVLRECQFSCSGGRLSVECGNLGDDQDLALANHHAQEAEDGATESGVEFHSVAPPTLELLDSPPPVQFHSMPDPNGQ